MYEKLAWHVIIVTVGTPRPTSTNDQHDSLAIRSTLRQGGRRQENDLNHPERTKE